MRGRGRGQGRLAWRAQARVLGALLACTGAWAVPPTPAWAWNQVKNWTLYRTDARGQRIWQAVRLPEMTAEERRDQLLEHLKVPSDRRAALTTLTQWPLDQWAPKALALGGAEAAHFLYRQGYRQAGNDPYAYLGSPDRLDRPWTQGLGLHLDPAGWRFQWIPSPALFTQSGNAALPKGLEQAAQPGVLIHLRQLRPGLARLQALAGGAPDGAGLVPALAQGSRAGFVLRHLEPWLREASPALEPLAGREAWILHYGVARSPENGLLGTLVFIPGDLPLRSQLLLGLLRLNPLSQGARVRTVTWQGAGGQVQVQQLRGSGGVFHLVARPEGTWISDREAPLRALLFPGPQPSLAERGEWARVALSAAAPDTAVSFWVVPRLGAGDAFECEALRRRLAGTQQGTWPNPFVAKAAPRTGALALSMGAGPTEKLVAAILRVDRGADIAEPEMPAFAGGGSQLSPAQRQAYEAAVAGAAERRRQLESLRRDLDTLLGALDLRGAALLWNGWVPAPPMTPAERAALTELARMRREDPWRASRMQAEGAAGAFGGFGEPGMSPSLALALPVQPAKRVQVENLLKKLLPRLFQGQNEKQPFGTAELHRVRTHQAFTPAWSLVGDTLVLGSDDGSVKAVAAGLLGQAPTLADSDSRAWARMEVDGARASQELETLLLAFLRGRQGGRWWVGEPDPAGDEASTELAASLGPFLGALKSLGTVSIEWNWTAGGLEGRPR
ncbi:MAG TPA: hypothetical protein VF804_07430 [Holophagaceae bacterium]